MEQNPLEQFSLKGRRALVTGGRSGIGRALAEGLIAAGAAVAISGRNERELVKTAKEIGATAAIRQDVAQVSDCHAGIETAAEALGGLEILINNAGVEQVRPSLDVDEATWDRILDTNLKGAFFCAQAAAAAMRKAGTGGTIVNICSLTSYRGIPTAVPYTASKSGLLGLTRALAAEWAPLKIRVNGLAPGYFRTELTETFYESQAWQDAMLDKIPAGRFGRLKDLVGAAIFLASDASAYITGQCLGVDGGTLASL